MQSAENERSPKSWNEILSPYTEPQLGKALSQLIVTSALFAGAWYLMFLSLSVSYWLTLLISIPAAGFLVRLFIFQHDCGHNSFFKSAKANDVAGFILGLATLTPYHYWRHTHAIHHATVGDLDRREYGDIKTLTVKEYLASSRRSRLLYRVYRNSLFMLVVGSIFQFVLKHRFPLDAPRAWKKEWASVIGTNLGIAALLLLGAKTIGLQRLFLVHMPIMTLGGIVGLWVFYIQHQFEDTYWEVHKNWDLYRAGIEGSSFYDLPPILHWFTGNIGYHHIHHLSSRIPNYRLKECFDQKPEVRHVTRLTAWQSLKCARLKLWDEQQRKLIGFRELEEHYLTG